MSYARSHGEIQLEGSQWHLYSLMVWPDELVSLGDPHEFIYVPRDAAAAHKRMPKGTKPMRATNEGTDIVVTGRLNLDTGVDDVPASGYLDTQLFEACKGTKFDRDVVGKHRRRKKKPRHAFAQNERDLNGELIAELTAEYWAKWIPVESSVIREVSYFEPTGRMEFKMKDYREYSFHDVSKAEFDSFMASKSKGKWFSEFIKSRRNSRKTAAVSPTFGLDTFQDEKPVKSEEEFAEQLSWLLDPPNGPQASRMTTDERIVQMPEDGGLAEPPVAIVRGRHGSTRYLWVEDGKTVGGLQVVKRGRDAVIANIYVAPEWRHKGIATRLVNLVKAKIPRIRLAPFFSGSGAGLMGFAATKVAVMKKTAIDASAKDIVSSVMEFWNSPNLESQIEQAKHGDDLNKVEVGKHEDVTVYFVNGNHVKREMFMDFVEGGNDAVYGIEDGENEHFMPKNEVWIDCALDIKATPYVMVHELYEMLRMKRDGLKYLEAHDASNELEYSLRNEMTFEKTRKVLRFPRIRQPGPATCAQACISMALQYYNEETGIDGISDEASASDNKEGLPPETIKRILEAHGAKAEIIENMTIAEVKERIDEDTPVIIEIQAWPKEEGKDVSKSDKDGHYVVAIGYTSNHIFFADPSSCPRTYLENEEMESRWHDVDLGEKKVRLGIVVTKGDAGEYNDEKSIKLGMAKTAAATWGTAGSGVLYYCPTDNTVMLLHRSEEVMDPNVWGIPGGAIKGTEGMHDHRSRQHTKFDEATLRDSAHQETEEEIGHLPEGPVDNGSVTIPFGNFKYTTFRKDVTSEQKEAITKNATLNWESADLNWFRVDQLPKNTHPGVVKAVQKMFGGSQ
jgi:8-oxo-dGTP pyrophosphatase MutT (NUDIX family)/GNAT superfamily N-acetyltransferase